MTIEAIDDALGVVGKVDSELVRRLGEPSQVRIINTAHIDASKSSITHARAAI
jgi:hypothetical protein